MSHRTTQDEHRLTRYIASNDVENTDLRSLTCNFLVTHTPWLTTPLHRHPTSFRADRTLPSALPVSHLIEPQRTRALSPARLLPEPHPQQCDPANPPRPLELPS